MSAKVRLVARFLVASGTASRHLRQRQHSRIPWATILAYHRIGDASRDALNGDPKIFSASPEEFAWQMDYLRRSFILISMDELIDRYCQGKPLPANAALVTFDDGYRDNLDLAAPILRARAVPAVIFLTTGVIGSEARLWWDALYEMLQATPKQAVELPGACTLRLGTPGERVLAMEHLRRQLKMMTEAELQEQMRTLRQILDVRTAPMKARRMHLNWDEVREMLHNGITFGTHTHTHPILTRISPERVEEEIATSKRIFEEELQRPVRFFAYPNGGVGDYDQQTKELLRRHGFDAAVALIHGANRLQLGIDWLDLRRIYIGSGDDRNTFIAKTSGALEIFTRRYFANRNLSY